MWYEAIPSDKLEMSLIELLDGRVQHEAIHNFWTGTTTSFLWVFRLLWALS